MLRCSEILRSPKKKINLKNHSVQQDFRVVVTQESKFPQSVLLPFRYGICSFFVGVLSCCYQALHLTINGCSKSMICWVFTDFDVSSTMILQKALQPSHHLVERIWWIWLSILLSNLKHESREPIHSQSAHTTPG